MNISQRWDAMAAPYSGRADPTVRSITVEGSTLFDLQNPGALRESCLADCLGTNSEIDRGYATRIARPVHRVKPAFQRLAIRPVLCYGIATPAPEAGSRSRSS